MSPETFAALLGAGVGALASGAVSIALQIQGQRRADRKERARDKDADRAALESIFMVIQECTSTARHLVDRVDEARSLAGKDRAIWQTMFGLANLPPHLELGPRDRAVLLRHGLGSLFNDVTDTVNCHNAAREAWQVYTGLRAEFGREVPAHVENGKGVAEFTDNELRRVGPLIAEMSSIGDQIASSAQDNAALSKATLEQVVEALAKIADVHIVVEYEPKDRSAA